MIPKGGEPRVVRGGSFNNNVRRVRCADRYRYGPNNIYLNGGFRVVVAPIL